MILKHQLLWAGHVSRLEDHRLSKIVMFSELSCGHSETGAPKKRFKDSLKKSLTACNITQSTKLLPSSKWTGKIHSKIRDRGGNPPSPPSSHQTFLFPAVTAHGPVSPALVWSATSVLAVNVNMDKLLKSSFTKSSHERV